jgi:hypothetical protein
MSCAGPQLAWEQWLWHVKRESTYEQIPQEQLVRYARSESWQSFALGFQTLLVRYEQGWKPSRQQRIDQTNPQQWGRWLSFWRCPICTRHLALQTDLYQASAAARNFGMIGMQVPGKRYHGSLSFKVRSRAGVESSVLSMSRTDFEMIMANLGSDHAT